MTNQNEGTPLISDGTPSGTIGFWKFGLSFVALPYVVYE